MRLLHMLKQKIGRKTVAVLIKDSYLLAIAFLSLLLVRLSLWRRPVPRPRKDFFWAHPLPVLYPFRTRPSLHKVLRAISISSQLMPGKVKCLARALTARSLAQRFDYPLSIHIGVAKQSRQQLEAHAWVEYHGQVVMGAIPQLSRFVSLLSITGKTTHNSTTYNSTTYNSTEAAG